MDRTAWLAPDERRLERARRRIRRRFYAGMAAVVPVDALAAVLNGLDGHPTSVRSTVVACVAGLPVFWVVLYLWYLRETARPATLDLLDDDARRQIRRALWTGRLPAPDLWPPLLLVARAWRRQLWWPLLAGTFLIAQAAGPLGDNEHPAALSTVLAIAVLSIVVAGWRLVTTNRFARQLPPRLDASEYDAAVFRWSAWRPLVTSDPAQVEPEQRGYVALGTLRAQVASAGFRAYLASPAADLIVDALAAARAAGAIALVDLLQRVIGLLDLPDPREGEARRIRLDGLPQDRFDEFDRQLRRLEARVDLDDAMRVLAR